uniref:NADH dehydrogenase subunit 2 n=1 Tax=Schistosoma malayensis TaxID=53353 RepID=Q9B894_9TREM|nr:NADH dehydrogenase subunit 2 [Schistosoma malayensis]
MFYSVLSISVLIFLSVILLFSGDLMVFWLLLELCGLSVIPCFYNNNNIDSLINVDSLLYYLLALGISSSLILVGIIFPDFFFFFFFGFFLKFGVFPFIFWVYQVFNGSKSWVVCWCISSVLKVSILYVCYFVSGYESEIIISLAGIGIIFCGLLIWVYNGNWFILWCHMMLASSNVIFCLSVVSSFLNLLVLYLVYFIWSSGVIYYLSSSSGSVFGYIVWLLAIPLSFALYYKVYVSYLLIGLDLVFLLLWILYSFLEQFYLFKWMVSSIIPKNVWCNCNVLF